MLLLVGACVLLPLVVGAGTVTWQLRRRGMARWVVPYLMHPARRRLPSADQDVHLLLCFADHYEPKWDRASPAVAQARVARWVEDYPKQMGRFRDSDGRPPRYTFFYPIEEYEPAYLDALGHLCRAGFGEVEVHLHHDADTPEGLHAKLVGFRDLLVERHGLLARERHSGRVMYGFIHGNWALCNSRPDGCHCGVNEELDVLRETGCYADFTFPSPDQTQPAMINSLYYARTLPGRPRSHERGLEIGTGSPPPDSLLLVQGPLLFDWGDCKWGVLPHVENGCLQGGQPPSWRRVANWLRARVQVPARPDWFFVKLHAHGAAEDAHEVLLGEPMVRFHEDLARHARENPRFHYHYVTAREMYNLIKAAESGWQGDVAGARDFLLESNVVAKETTEAPR